MLGMHLARFDFNIDWKDALTQGAQAISGFLVSYVPNIAQNIFLFAANFVIVLFTLFFFLRSGACFYYRLRHLLPMDHEHQDRLFENILNSVTAVFYGCLALLLQSVFLDCLVFWLDVVP